MNLEPGIAGHRRREDLQGLRAVAVLAVVAYHFGVPGVSGGFVGVDVFFVLSGFFITRLLLGDIERYGKVRLVRFWANRAKRLLPNALLTIVAVLLAATLLLPSYRLGTISQDGLSAAAFFSNFHFAAQTIDYFHLNDPPSPLLHYWSLAVEEQFYLALPLLLTGIPLVTRVKPRIVILLLLSLVAIVSFTASLIVIEINQPEAFFHPQYRAWQLAIGGIVGILFDQRHRLHPRIRATGAWLGALAVVASFVLLSEAMPYPGLRALAPTFGTAALILGIDAGGPSFIIARVLSVRPMALIGDMSYSLYLWHWPVAVFMAALWPTAGAGGVVAGLVVAMAAASMAYILVERPLHRRQLPPSRTWRALAAGAACVGLVAGCAAGLHLLPGRSDPRITAKIAAATADLGPNYHDGCHRAFNDVDQPACRFGKIGGPRVVLFGDSHAAQWFMALVKAGQETGWEVDSWTKTGCPSGDVTIWYPPTRSVYDACTTWRRGRIAALLADPPALVVLGNSYRYYGWTYDQVADGPADRVRAEALWRQGFEATARVLTDAGIPVVELHDTPQMFASYKDCLSAGNWPVCYRDRADALAGMPGLDPGTPLYTHLDLSDRLCSSDRCEAAAGGQIIYRDNEHLTASYAAKFYESFSQLLVEKAAVAQR